MTKYFTFSQFLKTYPDNNSCLEKLKDIQVPPGSRCPDCKKNTKFYKLKDRPAYTCKHCRHQIYPLAGTIFEKSTTPLQLWFFAMYVMTQTHAGISIKKLQRELGVTYKTAWRMYTLIRKLMMQNKGDLLTINETSDTQKRISKVYRWTLFNTVVISVVHKDEPYTDSGK